MPPAETTSSMTETLAGFVERHARQRPDGTAIRYGDRQWSWAQWASRIRRAAAALRAAGVQRGQCVAFLDKNHPACLEILFAAASIGAVTTVVNWRLAGDELVHVLNDSRPRLLFVGAELRAAVEAAAAQVPGLDRIIVVGDDEDEYESLLAAASPVQAAAEVDESETALCDLQLRHHRSTERCLAEPARAGQSRGESGAGVSVRGRGREPRRHAPVPRGRDRLCAFRHQRGGADDHYPRTRRRGVDRGGTGRGNSRILRATRDRPVPGRRRDGERHRLGPALHRVRGRPHAVALAAAGARDLARHELRPGVRTNGTVRGGHGAQRRRPP